MKDLNYDPQTQTSEDMIAILIVDMLKEGEKFATLEDADERTKCLEKIKEFREVIASLSPSPDDSLDTLYNRHGEAIERYRPHLVTRHRRRTYL